MENTPSCVSNNLPLKQNLFSAVFSSNFDKDGGTQLQSQEDICWLGLQQTDAEFLHASGAFNCPFMLLAHFISRIAAAEYTHNLAAGLGWVRSRE